jgi:hypothetical protein
MLSDGADAGSTATVALSSSLLVLPSSSATVAVTVSVSLSPGFPETKALKAHS